MDLGWTLRLRLRTDLAAHAVHPVDDLDALLLALEARRLVARPVLRFFEGTARPGLAFRTDRLLAAGARPAIEQPWEACDEIPPGLRWRAVPLGTARERCWCLADDLPFDLADATIVLPDDRSLARLAREGGAAFGGGLGAALYAPR